MQYAGRSLNKHERNYSVNELEALAVISEIKDFNVYLYGRKFKVFTDNSSITWLYSQKKTKGRIARWILKLQEYDFEIIFKAGRINSNADAVSRIPELKSTLAVVGIDNPEKFNFKIEQEQDKNISEIIKNLNKNTNNKQTQEYNNKYKIDSDGLVWKKVHTTQPYDEPFRLIVPQSLKHQILTNYHDSMLSGHRGIQTTYNKIRDRYFWKNMYNEVSNYCNTCQECNKKKVTNEIKAPLQPIPTERPFQTIGMDLIGPLPTTEVGNKYILVFIDALTKWSEAVPIIGIIAKHLYEHIICRHGTPENIITDKFYSHSIN